MSTADADQIEHLRRLWDQYGRLLTVVVVAVLAGLLGKHFYGSYQQRQATEAAALFAAYQQPPAGQTADALAAQLRAQYPRTSYASFVALAQAKQAVEAGKLDIAEQHLRWVVEHAGEPTDRALASLRLARVLLDQGKAQAAQDALGKDIPATSPALAELRGDIARAQGRLQDARQAYQEALAGLPPESGQAALIKLKLDALGQP
ncbi:MAG TPA: tetratricopeptide repeat protein [Immundisolibacter sp.]|nr:tetratricopeptide repeat protein [Immundisolibacter sp.]